MPEMPDFLQQVLDEIEAWRAYNQHLPQNKSLSKQEIDNGLGRFAVLIRTHQQNAAVVPSSSTMPPMPTSHVPPGDRAATSAASFHLTLEFFSVASFAAFVAVLRGGPVDETQLQQLASTLTQSSTALEQAIADAQSSPPAGSSPPSPTPSPTS